MKNVLVSTVLFFLTVCVFAQENEKKNREKDPSPTMNNALLASELANYGYTNKSAISLIDAAKILINQPFKDLTPDKSEPSNGNDGSKSQKYPMLAVEQLIKDARAFASGDKVIISLIDQTEKEYKDKNAVASKGRAYGPAKVNRKVYGNSSYVDYILFKGGELAEVAIIGDGDTDLDLYVYDENGNLVGSDTDYSDRCYVSFYPKWSGSFKIKVVNRGSMYNNYLLMTN